MQMNYAFWVLGRLCSSACSENLMGGSCPEGMAACEGSCVPAGIACGDSSLSGLSVSDGRVSPAFSPSTTLYTVQVPFWIDAVHVTATAVGGAMLLVNGVVVVSGTPSGPITIGPGPTMITVQVQVQGGAQKSYELVVMQSPIDYLKASNTEGGIPSAGACRCRETRWPWERYRKTAMLLGSTAPRLTTAPMAAARSTYSSAAAACGSSRPI